MSPDMYMNWIYQGNQEYECSNCGCVIYNDDGELLSSCPSCKHMYTKLGRAWEKIPGYGDRYFINTKTQEVKNLQGHIIKPIMIGSVPFVELRALGQRDVIALQTLIDMVKGRTANDSI